MVTNEELIGFLNTTIHQGNFATAKRLLGIQSQDLYKTLLSEMYVGNITFNDIANLPIVNDSTIQSLVTNRGSFYAENTITDEAELAVYHEFYSSLVGLVLTNIPSNTFAYRNKFNFYDKIFVSNKFLTSSSIYFNSEIELINSFRTQVIDVFKNTTTGLQFSNVFNCISNNSELRTSANPIIKKIVDALYIYSLIDENFVNEDNIFRFFVNTDTSISAIEQNHTYFRNLFTTPYYSEELVFSILRHVSLEYVKLYKLGNSQVDTTSVTNILTDFLEERFSTEFLTSATLFNVINMITVYDVCLKLDKNVYFSNTLDSDGSIQAELTSVKNLIESHIKPTIENIYNITKRNFI